MVGRDLQEGDIIVSKKFACGEYESDRSKIWVGGRCCANAYDPRRGTQKFVVEEAVLAGGNAARLYPDGLRVTARRLKPDGRYDPSGLLITFYMSGSFTALIAARDIRVVGRMRRSYF